MKSCRAIILCSGFTLCLVLSSFSGAALATEEEQKIAPEMLFALTLVNAEKGQGQAMLNLGIFYEEGVGVGRNFSKALEWYQKAAEAGEGDGYMRVGRCYEVGLGAAADMGKAVAAFEQAAALEHVPAFSKLAGVYLNGRGAAKDETKGFSLLTKAAEAGEGGAMFDLGLIALNGLYGRKTEPEKARTWFLKAAEAGHAGGIVAIANMCREGQGGRADAERALRWYLTAQKAGLEAQGLEEAIIDLKKTLPAKQAEAAEKTADTWLAARAEALKLPNDESGSKNA